MTSEKTPNPCRDHTHETNSCDQPNAPPRDTHCYPPRKACPPPPAECHPGIVDVPQEVPPFTVPTSPEVPGSRDRPKPGTPGEIPWFRGEIKKIRQKGASFGPRKDEFLPYLLARTAVGDRGARPFNGVFWESPDIFIAPNQEAATAPFAPPTTAGIAKANAPNTLYAHIWNLGKAPSYRVRVEFWWFNPSLGISRSSGHFIGATWVDLGNRFTHYDRWVEVNQPYGKYLSRGSHAIVRCPETWIPPFENNGHECLVVRAFEPMLDPVASDQFSPTQDRHIAQRNIAVVQAASPASIDLVLDLGYAQSTGNTEIEVVIEPPTAMEWLKLLTGRSNPDLRSPAIPVIAGLMAPIPQGARSLRLQEIPCEFRQHLLSQRERFYRGCDSLKIPFHAAVPDLKPHEAQVVRIRQRMDDQIVGGYSVVLVNLNWVE